MKTLHTFARLGAPFINPSAFILYGGGLLGIANTLVLAWILKPELVAALPLVGPWLESGLGAVVGKGAGAWFTAIVLLLPSTLGLWTTALSWRVQRLEAVMLDRAQRVCNGDEPPVYRADETLPGIGMSGAAAPAGQASTGTYLAFENVKNDATNYRFEPIATVVERVVNRIAVGTVALRDHQQLGLRLGILGTFIGMAAALVHVSAIFASGGGESNRQAVQDVVGSLSLAFGTSIAGLVAAICLQMILSGVRQNEKATVRRLHIMVSQMQAFCRRLMRNDTLRAEIEVLGEALRDHGEATDGVQHTMKELSYKVEVAGNQIAGAFSHPLQALRETSESLSHVLRDQRLAMEGLEAAGTVFDDHVRRLTEQFEAALKVAVARLEAHSVTVKAELGEMSRTLAEEIRKVLEGDGRVEDQRKIVLGFARLLDASERQLTATRRLTRLLAALVIGVALCGIGLSAYVVWIAERPVTIDVLSLLHMVVP